MQHQINPRDLTLPIQPSVIVDDMLPGKINVSLSPEIPITSFSLNDCFLNISFKGQSKDEWIKTLREIANQLEQEQIG